VSTPTNTTDSVRTIVYIQTITNISIVYNVRLYPLSYNSCTIGFELDTFSKI